MSEGDKLTVINDSTFYCELSMSSDAVVSINGGPSKFSPHVLVHTGFFYQYRTRESVLGEIREIMRRNALAHVIKAYANSHCGMYSEQTAEYLRIRVHGLVEEVLGHIVLEAEPNSRLWIIRPINDRTDMDALHDE